MMSVLRKRPQSDGEGPARNGSAGPEEQALAQRMRRLAVELRPEGLARLRLSRRLAAEARTVAESARKLCAESAAPDPALVRLSEEARQMAAWAAQARSARGVRLPACSGEPRILRVARALCARGDAPLPEDRFLLAVASFDDVQALSMGELWSAAAALRVAALEAYVQTARAVLADARERWTAERWLSGAVDAPPRGHLGEAFFERGLQLAAEQELPEARTRLEALLARQGTTPERCVNAAHEAQAVARLRLDNLSGIRRMLDAQDGQACFALLSRADQTLREDPSDAYAQMDGASRAAVRRELEVLARRLELGETALAAHAVAAAREAFLAQGAADARATVCWWLYTDAGRSALRDRLGLKARLPRLIPDPKGRGLIAGTTVLTGLLALGFARVCGALPTLLTGLPLMWALSLGLIGRLFPLWRKPRPLLKLDLRALGPTRRTLVVIPALLSSKARAEALCAQLETLGCLEKDPDLDFLLLGDFRDAESPRQAEDAEIAEAARVRVATCNDRAGRVKYFYLQRERAYAEADRLWRGHERKRGALMALNRLLLDKPGAEAAFAGETAACAALRGRYTYVVTLDADTAMLPGTAHRLVGALAHPLNRPHALAGRREGYAILQPNMELRAEASRSRFVRALAGEGGLDSYPVSVSSLHWDLTGRGCYGGKGVYDIRAFHAALEGALPENRVLSHDLIEGLVARAGFVNDVSLYDGFPPSPSGWLKRQERWTRGDWQLLPFLCGPRPRLDALDRFKLFDNLLRSLAAPALLLLFLLAAWTGNAPAFALASLLAFADPLLALPHGGIGAWRRAAVLLALLPERALSQLGGAGRALWRGFVSGRHRLDWVTAADAERAGGGDRHPFARMAALLLLPAALRPALLVPGLALAALFALGPEWLHTLSETPADAGEGLRLRQIEALTETARETWRFFERYVSGDAHGLPPDNVQLDPPLGAARRTSPTNIGLYLLACLSAWKLGFLGRDDLRARVAETLATMESLEKWRGQLYNWYDTDSLQPLRPRYVSAVDSGNLAACLLLAAEALADCPELRTRLRALASAMDFTALYDARRKLFHIGMDVDGDRLSAGRYDLLASESRLLSYTAMMLGQVPVGHWRHLGRPSDPCAGGPALLSWSGTMFEYLMPELVLRAPAHSLLGQANRAAVRAQVRHAGALGRPWGVSESGYCAFDANLNFQYRAFGLAELALNGTAKADVVAPYASILALSVAPAAAAENILRMRALGWTGECGFFEAADYADRAPGEPPRLVRSHMAHHQGMALCALANALCGDFLPRCFAAIPEARSLALLLEEKPLTRKGLARRSRARDSAPPLRRAEDVYRCATVPGQRLVDAQPLSGAGATAVCTARGGVLYGREGILATPFSGDFLRRREGICLHLRLSGGGRKVFGGEGTRVDYRPGSAGYALNLGPVTARLRVAVSPEDGALFEQVDLINTGTRTETVELTDCFAVALASPADMRAHPAFQKLFVTGSRPGRNALAFTRRKRSPEEQFPTLAHLASGGEIVGWETDMARLVGRSGALSDPEGIAEDLSGTLGDTLNPCSALRVRAVLAPGEARGLHFAIGLVAPDALPGWLERNAGEEAPGRACQLAETQAAAQLGFLGLRAPMYQLARRAVALLLDGYLGNPEADGPRPGGACASALWPLGLSGDLPILCVCVADAKQMDNAREAVRLHEFYHSFALRCDLVLINDHKADYDQPLREALRDLVAASALHALAGKDGGAHLIEGEQLGADQRAALLRASAFAAQGPEPLAAQLRQALQCLRPPEAARLAVLPDAPDSGEAEEPAPRNGHGDFSAAGDAYVISIGPGRETPAPWSNILANESFGALLTERGGGFLWQGNSRNGRLTAFDNDALNEGWGLTLLIVDDGRRALARLLPGRAPERRYRVEHGENDSRWTSAAPGLSFAAELYVRKEETALLFRVEVANTGTEARELRLIAAVDWLLGVDAGDARRLRLWQEDGICFAAGSMPGVAFLSAPGEAAEAGPGRALVPAGLPDVVPRGGALNLRLRLDPGQRREIRLRAGWAEDAGRAAELARLPVPTRETEDPFAAFRYRTPDADLDRLLNHFLPRQVLNARVRGRCGLYQAGGAYGFRDQLQDMLALLPYEPARVREHLLRCASKQFPEGDVLHWWHPPGTGVRTHVSDDLLFLPFVTACYVRATGDAGILQATEPFLEDLPIPEGRADAYAQTRPSGTRATLHAHCLRAFQRASRTGEHGLLLMGGGDWNDGMNRVGAQGRGESVWLTQFCSVCAALYAEICPDPAARRWLLELRGRLNSACETFAWDGAWYLRAYTDAGTRLGSRESEVCRIDLISQAWAVLAGLDEDRCQQALDSAWTQLVDAESGVIRLLAPPFDEAHEDPGYIRGYPPGVRENGGQYTHAACWYALALAMMGDPRAHRALRMLLPTAHTQTPEAVRRYRVEPYVMAADVYGEAPHAGRGGWTWYTGSAAWMLLAAQALLGYARRGDQARLNALLGDWPEAGVDIRVGASLYRLRCRPDVSVPTLDGQPLADGWARLTDDGATHEALFPPRDKNTATG